MNATVKANIDPVDSYVGNQVRKRRYELEVSQTKLGDAVGVQFQQVQKYETGANRVSASRLAKMAKYLNVPIGFFFPVEYQVPADRDVLSPAEDSLLAAWRGLSLRQRTAVTTLLASME